MDQLLEWCHVTVHKILWMLSLDFPWSYGSRSVCARKCLERTCFQSTSLAQRQSYFWNWKKNDIDQLRNFDRKLFIQCKSRILPTHWMRHGIGVFVAKILMNFTAFERADDFIGKIKISIIIEETNQQIANSILTNGYCGRWIFEMHGILWMKLNPQN